MKIAAVLPAYNEASRVASVIKACRRSPSIDEIVVVNDGSSDNTADVVRGIPGVTLVDLKVNRGKGGAMTAGVEATDADVLVFLDADLIGLRPEHVEALVAPVRTGRSKMAVGQFHGGRWLTDLSQRVVPVVSGQRAIRRDVFEQMPDIADTRYGVEMAITRFCRHYRVQTANVMLHGVTHPMKEEKIGFVRGWCSRTRMYYEVVKIMLDPRAPKRIKRDRVPRFLRRIAANQRMNGKEGAGYWLYRQERRRRRRSPSSTWMEWPRK